LSAKRIFRRTSGLTGQFRHAKNGSPRAWSQRREGGPLAVAFSLFKALPHYRPGEAKVPHSTTKRGYAALKPMI
jgi:hypothetical protein